MPPPRKQLSSHGKNGAQDPPYERLRRASTVCRERPSGPVFRLHEISGRAKPAIGASEGPFQTRYSPTSHPLRVVRAPGCYRNTSCSTKIVSRCPGRYRSDQPTAARRSRPHISTPPRQQPSQLPPKKSGSVRSHVCEPVPDRSCQVLFQPPTLLRAAEPRLFQSLSRCTRHEEEMDRSPERKKDPVDFSSSGRPVPATRHQISRSAALSRGIPSFS